MWNLTSAYNSLGCNEEDGFTGVLEFLRSHIPQATKRVEANLNAFLAHQNVFRSPFGVGSVGGRAWITDDEALRARGGWYHALATLESSEDWPVRIYEIIKLRSTTEYMVFCLQASSMQWVLSCEVLLYSTLNLTEAQASKCPRHDYPGGKTPSEHWRMMIIVIWSLQSRRPRTTPTLTWC